MENESMLVITTDKVTILNGGSYIYKKEYLKGDGVNDTQSFDQAESGCHILIEKIKAEFNKYIDEAVRKVFKDPQNYNCEVVIKTGMDIIL